MNDAQQQFTPAWAASVLGPKPDSTLELKLLWAFFGAWEALHAIPNTQGNRRKAEAAAEVLVDAAHALRTLRAPERIANGR